MEDRLNKLEKEMLELKARVSKMEERMADIETKVVRMEGKQVLMDDKVAEVLSEFTISEIKHHDAGKQIGDRLNDLSGKLVALEVQFQDVSVRWPSLEDSRVVPARKGIIGNGAEIVGCKGGYRETSQDVTSERNKADAGKGIKAVRVDGSKAISFSEKYRDKKSDTVLVVGDSLVRGVGAHLERDSQMYSSLSLGGARIETVEAEITRMGEKPESHLVVMVGTNNIKNEGSEIIMGWYEKLLDEAEKQKFRKISVVGILRRDDLSSFQNSRRIGINLRLQKLCKDKGIGFVYKDLVTEHLGRDKLHLSEFGQEEVGRCIFRHCKHFLI